MLTFYGNEITKRAYPKQQENVYRKKQIAKKLNYAIKSRLFQVVTIVKKHDKQVKIIKNLAVIT